MEKQIKINEPRLSENIELSTQELLDKIEYNTGSFPKGILEELINRKTEIIPFLLDILRKVNNNPEKYRHEKDYFAHIYAAYFLSQFRVKEAYPILLDIMCLPDGLPYDLFGDSILEDGSRMIASVCGSDLSIIKALIEDEKTDEYMGSIAIKALAILALQGVVEREAVIIYYDRLIGQTSVRNNPMLMAGLVHSSCDIYADELYEDIKRCYEEDLVDESFISLEDVDEVMEQGKDGVLEESANNPHLQFIDDAIGDLEWWDCFDENYRERNNQSQNFSNMETIIKPAKIGRNDPCPCGSGKKYKKCCGK